MVAAGLGWSHRTRLAMVELQQDDLIVVDGARVLANVAGAVDAARQLLEVPPLNGIEGADADLRRFGNLLEERCPGSCESWPSRARFSLLSSTCPSVRVQGVLDPGAI